MDFHFLVMGESWKINVEKEGAPWKNLAIPNCRFIHTLMVTYWKQQKSRTAIFI